MLKRISYGLISAILLAIVSLIISSIRGEMNWNHLIGALISGFIIGAILPFFQKTSRKDNN